MKKLNFLFSIIFLFFATSFVNSQNINVNPGAGSYPTLKDAFDAINAGTHTGTVTIDVVGNTTETATAVLNASGTGAANYTSIIITPSGVPRIIEGSLSGINTGSIIRFAGADNVTIDGRIRGTGRNLTVRNNSTDNFQACIFLSAEIQFTGDTNGCRNNVIRNLELSCGADQSLNTFFLTFGVASGLAYTGLGSKAINNDLNEIVSNRIVKVTYGVYLGGGDTDNLNDNNNISGNAIGPDAYGPEQIGRSGIYVDGQNECVISCNTIKNVGRDILAAGQNGGTDRFGIALGQEEWNERRTTTTTGTNNIINANTIINVQETRGFSALGIICGANALTDGGITNNIISNNVIYNVRANGRNPDQAVGIGYIGGTATINARQDKIVYNSIYMSGLSDPAPSDISTEHTIGIKINSESATNDLTIKNNSIYLDVTSRNPGLLHYCIAAPSASYDWGTGGCNNNDYYFPVTNTQMRTGGLGSISPLSSSFLTLALWQGAFTTPGPQDAASIQADPLYTLLPTTYPLIPNTGSPLLMAAAPLPGFTTDINVCESPELRSATQPTIGAYEYTEQTLPVELASFISNVTGRDATLNWTTASENNNSAFDVERSEARGQMSNVWTKIGNVAGNGTTTSAHSYSYTDRNLASGKYKYRLKQIDFNGNFEYYNLNNEVIIGLPVEYELSQNYPNPFNPTTNINYQIPSDGFVSLKIFDMSGKEIATLINEVKAAGYYNLSFNASDLSSGVYFYSLSSGNFSETKRMLLLK